jgi:succinate dehydrogenase/fumarate reductase cytochrome b subunit
VVTWNKDYLGPAPLNRAWTLVNDVRDAGNDARIDAISGSAGCPRLPFAHELHRVLSARHFADLFDRRLEARHDLARAGEERHDRDPVHRAARLRRGAGFRRHRASRHYSLRGARRPDRRRGAGRTRDNHWFFAFYVLFVLAVAVHAPIGLRNVLREWTRWHGRSLDVALRCSRCCSLLGSRGAGGLFRRGAALMMRASHTQPGFLAALLHRLAGIALAIFLPLHFWRCPARSTAPTSSTSS